MLKFGNKEFRNLQEQVLKNMRDIQNIMQGTTVLAEFGIKVIGQVDTAIELPDPATYEGEYGDAYVVGTEEPYEYYIFTRAFEGQDEPSWFDLGIFPVPGPQGPQGIQGPVGPQGQTGATGADGTNAGFGTVSATATTLPAGSDATVSVVASGPNTEKSFAFTFGIPEGEQGASAECEWGSISGDLSDQTDLVNALQAKQNANTAVTTNTAQTISGNKTFTGWIDVHTAIYGNDAWLRDINAAGGMSTKNGLTLGDISDSEDSKWHISKSSDDNLHIYNNDVPAKSVITSGPIYIGFEQASDKVPVMSEVVTAGASNIAQHILSPKSFDRTVWFDDLIRTKHITPITDDTYSIGSGSNRYKNIATERLINNNSDYGINMPDTSTWTADKTIATLDDIAASGVQDVEVNGTSVVDAQGVAEVTVPTDTSDLTNNAGFITSSALSGYATETWVGQQGYLTSVSWSDVSNKPNFATVATSGDYDDLTDKPDLSVYAESADLGDCAYLDENELSIAYSQITGTPTIPTATSDLTNDSGFITGIDSSDVISALGYTPGTSNFSGSYLDLTDTPDLSIYAESADLATVATTGDYEDLLNKPTIPTDTSDLSNGAGFITLNALTGYATESWVGSQGYLTSVSWNDVSSKPSFATVATSGSYADLSNKPSIPTVSGTNDGTNWTSITINSDTYAIPSGGISTVDWSDIQNKPTFATVATSGDYDDLLNKPTIPAAQVNSDWNAASGVAQILNKPNLATVATSGSYNDLTDKPTIPTVPVQDVTVDGVSVVSSGTAAITMPTIPTSLPIETLTTEPSAAYTGPGLKLVYLSAEPTTKYAGYIYMIAES